MLLFLKPACSAGNCQGHFSVFNSGLFKNKPDLLFWRGWGGQNGRHTQPCSATNYHKWPNACQEVEETGSEFREHLQEMKKENPSPINEEEMKRNPVTIQRDADQLVCCFVDRAFHRESHRLRGDGHNSRRPRRRGDSHHAEHHLQIRLPGCL